jgi:hypothetical protein
MLQTFKKVLANSEPSTHGGKADMTMDATDLNLACVGASNLFLFRLQSALSNTSH